jgi:hypothetical protein
MLGRDNYGLQTMDRGLWTVDYILFRKIKNNPLIISLRFCRFINFLVRCGSCSKNETIFRKFTQTIFHFF